MSQEVEMHICLGSSCFSRGNKEVVFFIKEYLRKHHLEDKVIFKGARCIGNCSKGPNMRIQDKMKEGITLATVEAFLEHELMRFK
jgi:NADH:ubiquinone oxidoreductase subunit E